MDAEEARSDPIPEFAPGDDDSAPLSDLMRQQLIEDLHIARTGFGFADDTGEIRFVMPSSRPDIRDGAGEVSAEAFVRSPACGDEVRVQLAVQDGLITRFNWQGHGCVVSTASASALAGMAIGLDVVEFAALAVKFSESVWRGIAPDSDLGDAAVFAGIGRIPLRGRCATLSWNATADALAQISPDAAA